MEKYLDIVFDGPPSHESGRFVEVEDENGASVGIGKWVEDGEYWRLRIPDHRVIEAERDELRAEVDEQAKIIGKSIDDSDKWAMEKRGMERENVELRERVEAAIAWADAMGVLDILSATSGTRKKLYDAILQPDSGKDEQKDGEN